MSLKIESVFAVIDRFNFDNVNNIALLYPKLVNKLNLNLKIDPKKLGQKIGR